MFFGGIYCTNSHSHFQLYLLGVQITFNEVPSVVTEDQGPVNVCVELLGTLQRSVTMNINLNNIGTTPDDFSIDQLTVIFGNGGTNPQCIQLVANPDVLLESDENFSIILSSTDDAVDIVDGTAVVTIQDSSTLRLGFSQVPESVEEGEVFSACVNIIEGSLSGQFQLPISIVSLSGPGSYAESCTLYKQLLQGFVEYLQSVAKVMPLLYTSLLIISSPLPPVYIV